MMAIFVIVVYAPTAESTEEETAIFSEALEKAKAQCKSDETLYDHRSWEI